jgi:hypothetical protein
MAYATASVLCGSGTRPRAGACFVAEEVARPLGAKVIAWRRAIAPGSLARGSAFTLSPGSFKPPTRVRGSGFETDRGPDRAMSVRYRRSCRLSMQRSRGE